MTLRGDGNPEELLLDLRGRTGWTGTISALRIEADGPVALTRVGGLDPADIMAPPPPADPDAGPDAAPPVVEPDAGPGAEPDASPPGADPDFGLAPGPDPLDRQALAREAHYEGGCAATPLEGVPLLGLAALALRRRRRR
jgi:MYXO-CTERM domain-containing protein